MKITLILALLTTVWTGTGICGRGVDARIRWSRPILIKPAEPEPQVAVVQLGAKFMFPCPTLMNGNASDLVWTENGSKFVPRKGYSLTVHKPRFGTLTIDRLKTSDNGTVFTCSAANRAGASVYGVIRLLVLAQDDLPRGFPMIDSGESNKRIRHSDSGDVVRLPCTAYGNPMPYTTWFKDSVPIDRTDNRYSNVTSTDLFIRNVQPNDRGIYECSAYNIHGKTISKPFELYVRRNEATAFCACLTPLWWWVSIIFGTIIGVILWRLTKSKFNLLALPVVAVGPNSDVDSDFDLIEPIDETDSDSSKSDNFRQLRP